MKNLYKLIVLFSMALSLGSCYYDTYYESVTPPPDDISYSNDIEPLWKDDCEECHKGASNSFPPDLRVGVSYDNLIDGYVEPGDSENSILYQTLVESNGRSLMPPDGAWPQSTIELVKAWIDQGAENN